MHTGIHTARYKPFCVRGHYVNRVAEQRFARRIIAKYVRPEGSQEKIQRPPEVLAGKIARSHPTFEARDPPLDLHRVGQLTEKGNPAIVASRVQALDDARQYGGN